MIDLFPAVGKQVILLLKAQIPVVGALPGRELQLVPVGATDTPVMTREEQQQPAATGYLLGTLCQDPKSKGFWLSTRNYLDRNSMIDIIIELDMVAVCYVRPTVQAPEAPPVDGGAQ